MGPQQTTMEIKRLETRECTYTYKVNVLLARQVMEEQHRIEREFVLDSSMPSIPSLVTFSVISWSSPAPPALPRPQEEPRPPPWLVVVAQRDMVFAQLRLVVLVSGGP